MTGPKHNTFEDVFGITTGSIMIACGIAMLHNGGILTGGIAGLSLMLSKIIGIEVGTIYLISGIPFMVFAAVTKGMRFAIRSTLTLTFVSLLVNVFPHFLTFKAENLVMTSIIANILLGVGMLIIFRHQSSMGGFNVIAILAQERLRWKAGYVQLILDGLVLLSAFSTYSLRLVLISILGDAVLNSVLAINHRSDRYVGYSR